MTTMLRPSGLTQSLDDLANAICFAPERHQCSRCGKYFPKEFITIDDEFVEGNKKFCMYCDEELSNPDSIEDELKKNYSTDELVDAFRTYIGELDPVKDYSEIQGLLFRIEKLTRDSEDDIWENIQAYRQ